MWNIPPSIWQVAPKDVTWWMGAMPHDGHDDNPCPGHGYVVDDSGDMEFCDGSCVTEEENRS